MDCAKHRLSNQGVTLMFCWPVNLSATFTTEQTNRDTLPQLATLVLLMRNTWNSSARTESTARERQPSVPAPDLRHTWLEEPVRLENALGHGIPIYAGVVPTYMSIEWNVMLSFQH